MLLKIKNINKSYNESHSEKSIIFKNLDFSFEEENIITVYGPSGIGKTTLLNIIGTVDSPDSGDIYLNDIKYGPKTYQDLRKNHIGYLRGWPKRCTPLSALHPAGGFCMVATPFPLALPALGLR